MPDFRGAQAYDSICRVMRAEASIRSGQRWI
jgi:hypothetical protein